MFVRNGAGRLRQMALVAGACALAACTGSDPASDGSEPGSSSPSTAPATAEVTDTSDANAEGAFGWRRHRVRRRSQRVRTADRHPHPRGTPGVRGRQQLLQRQLGDGAGVDRRPRRFGPVVQRPVLLVVPRVRWTWRATDVGRRPRTRLAPPFLRHRAGRHSWIRPRVRRPTAGPCDQRRPARRPHRDRADRGPRHVRGWHAVHVARPYVLGRRAGLRPAGRGDRGLAAHRSGGVRCRTARSRSRRRVARAGGSRRHGR